MATQVFYTGDGTTLSWDISFPYISRDHVFLSIDETDTAFDWVTDTRVQVAAAPAIGSSIRIYRDTPIDDPTVEFSDGSVLTGNDLNLSDQQLLYKQQEQDDQLNELDDRAVKVAPGEEGLVIPSLEARRNKYALFDAGGKITAVDGEDAPSSLRLPSGAGNVGTLSGATIQEAIAVASDPVSLLASTSGTFPEGAILRTADGFQYQVLDPEAEGHVVTAGGVQLSVLPGPTGFNVKAFGAVGDNVADDTAAIQRTIDIASTLGHAAYVPPGNYKVSALTLGASARLVGENPSTSILYGQSTHPIITLNGQYAQVAHLYLRGGSHGVKSVAETAQYSKVMGCRISYNRIGIELNNAYITTVKDNIITFNSWGIVNGNQSFQVVIRDNVIDNNLGGGGIFMYGSSGSVIDGNTIEGNRKEDSPGGPSIGFGLWVAGLNQRTIIRDNWFEQNGNQDGASDIILSRPTDSWVDTLVTSCVPSEYAAQVGSTQIVTGQVEVEGNFFFSTKRAISFKLDFASNGAGSIRNNTFSGSSGKNNRAIELYGGSAAYKLSIESNAVTNTGNTSINTEMLVGVKGSYVFHSGNNSNFGQILLDGQDLLTAYVTSVEFAALPGASLDATSRIPSSGAATLKNGAIKASQGVAGTRVVTGTGRPRAGQAAWFGTLNVPTVVITLGFGSSAAYGYQNSSGFAQVYSRGSSGHHSITTVTPVSAEATLYTGDYVGWLISTPAALAGTVLNGCTRIVVTDLDVVERPLFGTAAPSSSAYSYSTGDIIYNSAPTAGGNVGWVCVAGGTPGTWKTFGTIAA